MAVEQFGCTRDGMLANYLSADASALVTLPEHLSFEQACTLPCAAVTAWNALVGGRSVGRTRRQRPGHRHRRRCLVRPPVRQGPRREGRGNHVESAEGGDPAWPERRRRCRPQPAFRMGARVRRLTNGIGVDHVVETGVIGTLPQSLAACAANAEVALVAALGQGSLDAAALRGLVTIRRVFVGSRTSFEDMNRAIALHRLAPVIGEAEEG
jgi:NADPH:quinone reductase-like Zn-dependent oxidoreductase